jgi:hypothetical protein
VPHRIVIRLFRSNDITDRQVTALLWALTYVRNVLPPLFFGVNVRLFYVGYALVSAGGGGGGGMR